MALAYLKKGVSLLDSNIWDIKPIETPEAATGPKMLLDTPGKFKFQIYTPGEKEVQMQKEESMRPVDIIKEQLTHKLSDPNDNKTYFLKAGTGAGKSTFFLNELMEMLGAKDMICTKPRVKLVLDPMEELPLYFPQTFKAGGNLGFKVGGRELVATAHPSLTFCTTQILGNLIQYQPDTLEKYRFCVIDEVHDMSEQMLALLYQIKSYLVNKTPESPIFIFMSATLNMDKFKRYFYSREYTADDIGFLIPSGMKFPVVYKYFSDTEDLKGRLISCLKFLNEHYKQNDIPSKEFKDILIFTKGNPTLKEMVSTCQDFHFSFKVDVFPYTAKDTTDQTENYAKFNTEMPNVVKIIVSTTLLEAGANIPHLYTVIDTAIQQKPIFNNITKQNQIQAISCSKSSVEQRKGRVGRNGEGIYCGLYPESIRLEEDDPNPMLMSKQIFTLVFQFVRLMLKKTTNPRLDLQLMDLIEPISADVTISMYHRLINLGLIAQDGTITPFFKIMVDQGYNQYVKYMAVVYECKPFDAALVCALQTYDLGSRDPPLVALERVLKGDYSGVQFNKLIEVLGAAYDILKEWGTYPELKHWDPHGAEKLYQTLA